MSIGDEVCFYTLEGLRTGLIKSIDGDTATITDIEGEMFFIPFADVEVYLPTGHECAPYVGIVSIEPHCVYCDRFLNPTEISDYLKRKVSL